MTHREKVIARLNTLLSKCPTQSQRDMVAKQIEYAKSCNDDEIAKFDE